MTTRIQWSGTEYTHMLVRLPVEAKAEVVELARHKDMSATALVLDAVYRYLQAERASAQAERNE